MLLHKPLFTMPLYSSTMSVYSFSGSDCRTNDLLVYSITCTHTITGLHKEGQGSLINVMKDWKNERDKIYYTDGCPYAYIYIGAQGKIILNGAAMGWLMIFMGWHVIKYKSEAKSQNLHYLSYSFDFSSQIWLNIFTITIGF